MLAKENRLIKKKDFENLLKNGKTYYSPLFILKVIKNKLKITRFGFIISKKTTKKAVIRNKIKRRLREIIRKEIKELGSGFDGVIIVKNNPLIFEKDYYQIKKEINQLIQKAKLKR